MTHIKCENCGGDTLKGINSRQVQDFEPIGNDTFEVVGHWNIAEMECSECRHEQVWSEYVSHHTNYERDDDEIAEIEAAWKAGVESHFKK